MSNRNFYILIILIANLIFGCRKSVTNNNTYFKVIQTNSSFAGLKTIQLTNGSYVIVMNEVTNRNRCFLITINENGQELWRKDLGDDFNMVTDIQPLPNSNFVVSSIDDSSQMELGINAFSASGQSIWRDSYVPNTDSFLIQSVKLGVTSNTIHLISTLSNDYYKKENKIINIKYSLDGMPISKSTIATDTTTIYTSFQIIALNDQINITGYFRNHTYDSGYKLNDYYYGSFLMNYNEIGHLNWMNKMGYQDNNQNLQFFLGESLCVDKSQNLIQAGILSTVDKNTNIPRLYNLRLLESGGFYRQNTGDVMVVKLNGATGDTINYQIFSLLNLSQRVEVNNTSDNGCILIATDNKYLYNSYYPSKATLIKLDQNLNQQWQTTLNTPYPVAPFSVFQTPNGGYMIFSMVQSFNKTQDLAIFRTDARGNL